MKNYLAPLEGITTVSYRKAYHQTFKPMDKYFTPFIASAPNKRLTEKERFDIHPDNNKGMYTVPQILSNNAVDFLHLEKQIYALGYTEINLNLGCPSNTVASKGKGSSFLFHKRSLQLFLDTIFSKSNAKISIKTRLGKYEPDEFYDLALLFSQYPLEELIIHPRVQKDMYRNFPRMDVFGETYKTHKTSVVYNGDLFCVEDYENLITVHPNVSACMFGRGILANPGLLHYLNSQTPVTDRHYRKFHDTIFESYAKWLKTDTQLLNKLKEFWSYFSHSFENATEFKKAIFNTTSLDAYLILVETHFDELIRITASESINQAFKTHISKFSMR